MSTPSTAVATTIRPQYGHAHYQTYHPLHSSNDPALSSTSTFNPAYASYPTLARTSTNSRQPAINSSKTTPHIPHASNMPPKSKQKKPPNWHEFFKNGVPDEIIVIEDSPPPQQKSNGVHTVNGVHTTNHAAVAQNGLPAEHASKKRRTDLGNGTAARNQVTYSDHNTPQQVGSNDTTISLDRTTSIHTTAPTSLGSNGSANSAGHNDAQVTGQKRKRVTRQAAAGEKKRKQQQDGAFSDYVPPRKPPIKAHDVPVRLIREVSRLIVSYDI